MEKRGHSSNGFTFGLILGVILTLLFTTKKGRKILGELSENFLDMAENKFNFDNFDEELDDEDESENDDQNGKKRIFKGVKKTATK